MQPFEYLSVLVSIIVGLGLSHLLTTAARLIQERERVSFYPPTLIRIGILFVPHIQIWWAAFGWQDERVWGFLAFLLFLSLPISTYLLGVLLVQDLDRTGPVDLKANYFSNRVAFYAILTLLPITSRLHESLHGGNIHCVGRQTYRSCITWVQRRSAGGDPEGPGVSPTLRPGPRGSPLFDWPRKGRKPPHPPALAQAPASPPAWPRIIGPRLFWRLCSCVPVFLP